MNVCSKWKTCALILSLFSAALLHGDKSVFAQASTESALPRSATVDLDGDGKPEKIAVSGTKEEPLRLILSVNSVKLTEKDKSFDSDTPPDFRVVKINSDSKIQQIAVEFTDPSGLSTTYFYRWDGKVIRRVGIVPNADKLSGNGAVYGSTYLDFWTCKLKYTLDAKSQTLRLVRQPMYAVEVPATVKASFPLLQDHAVGSKVVATTAPGSKIQLVMFWSPVADPGDSTQANSWFLIKTATGLSGWTRLPTFKEKVDGLIYGG